MEIKELDLGPCRARSYRRGGTGWAVLMPGASYSVEAPVLWFAREAAMAAGLDVLAVINGGSGRDRRDPTAVIEERAVAALERVRDPSPVLIGKSISTLAAGIAAQRQLPAVWLTPLLNTEESALAGAVTAALQTATRPSLLVGGTADPLWSSAVARSVPLGEVLEIDRADHVLQVVGDPIASLAVLRALTERLTAFIGRVRADPRGN
jgi:hypothetical protein